MNRAKAIPAVLMWLCFTTGLVFMVVFQILGIFAWLLTGKEEIEDWVTLTGKASDQAVNAAIFAGHPKETISSHIGKRYYLHYKFDGRFVGPTRPMRLIRAACDVFEKEHVFRAIELQPGIEFTPEMKAEAIQLAMLGKL